MLPSCAGLVLPTRTLPAPSCPKQIPRAHGWFLGSRRWGFGAGHVPVLCSEPVCAGETRPWWEPCGPGGSFWGERGLVLPPFPITLGWAQPLPSPHGFGGTGSISGQDPAPCRCCPSFGRGVLCRAEHPLKLLGSLQLRGGLGAGGGAAAAGAPLPAPGLCAAACPSAAGACMQK